MLIKKVIFVSVMAIALILMASTAFAAKLTINTNTQMTSLTIGDDVNDEVEVSDGKIVTVNGNVTIGASTGGVLTMGAGSQMVCSGTFTKNANGTINANTSQITFNGGDTQSINAGGATLYDAVFSTGAKSIAGSLTVGHQLNSGGLNVTIAGGNTLTLGANSNTYISGGAWTLTGTLTCDATSTIHYTSGIAQNVLPVTHGRLTHNGAGTLSLTGGLTCAGLLTNTTGDFTPGANAITAGGIVWTAGSITGTPTGAWDIGTSGVNINGGAFVATSGAFTCGGNWNMTGAGTFTAGTSTVDFDGAGLTITSDGKKFYGVAISENASLADAMAFLAGGSLTVDAGKTFALGANGLAGTTNPAIMTNNGTITADGGQTITLVTWDNARGLTVINGAVGATLTNFADSFYDLNIGGDNSIMLGKNITVAHNMEVLTGTTFNMATHGIQLTGGGTVTNNGTWAVPTAGTFTCLGSANFIGNNINFYNFSCDAPNANLTFAATKTYQVDGTLTLNGQAAGTKINLSSDTPGSAFIIQNDGGSESVQFVSVRDCTATTNPIHAASSTLVSNVTNWIFSIISVIAGGLWNAGATWVGGVVPAPTDNVTIAGNVDLNTSPTVNNLTVEADKTLACGANNITVNGASDINGTIAISTGTYTANGNFDATGGTINFTGAGSLLLGGATITSLGTLSDNNGTVNYNRAGVQTVLADAYNNLTISGGVVKTLGGAIIINGGLSIAADTTLDVGGSNFAISVAGNWSNSGTFTARNGGVTFTGGVAQLLAPGASSFHNLTINKTGGADTVTPNANLGVTNDLTLTDGTLVLTTNNPNVTIGHALSIANGAVWTAGTGTLTFNGADCTLSDANTPPNNLGNVKVE